MSVSQFLNSVAGIVAQLFLFFVFYAYYNSKYPITEVLEYKLQLNFVEIFLSRAEI